jgi:hypothetical protein
VNTRNKNLTFLLRLLHKFKSFFFLFTSLLECLFDYSSEEMASRDKNEPVLTSYKGMKLFS